MHLSTPFVLVTFAYLFAGFRCGDGATCDTVMDLAFLVDKSGSIQNWQWLVEKEFVYNVTDGLDIGADKTHVAMSLFATGFHLKWCFLEHTDKAALLTAENDMACPECVKGKTSTGLGLKGVREEMLVQACDVRSLDQNIPRVVVVLTDGASTEKPPKFPKTWLKDQADLLRLDGEASVLAVGVGDHFATPTSRGYADLEQIADNKDMIFATDNFDKLGSLREKIFAQICEAAEKGCEAKVDIVFMLDVSGSIYRKKHKNPIWNLMKEFVKEMINEFDIGANAHVAMQVFADVAENSWCFDKYTSKAAMKHAVNNLECTTCSRGQTSIGGAMDNVREFILTQQCQVRAGVPNIVIMLSDGKSTEDKAFFRTAAAKLKATPDTTVMAIGMGDYKLERLEKIASSDKWVFKDIHFDNALAKAKMAAKAACAKANDTDEYRPCKAGWTLDVRTQQCYRFFSKLVPGGLSNIRAVCNQHNASPVDIKSRYTQDVVNGLSGGRFVWLNIEHINGGWFDSNGAPVTWTAWGPGEPRPGRNCAVTFGFSRKSWQSNPCGAVGNVVCSMPRE